MNAERKIFFVNSLSPRVQTRLGANDNFGDRLDARNQEWTEKWNRAFSKKTEKPTTDAPQLAPVSTAAEAPKDATASGDCIPFTQPAIEPNQKCREELEELRLRTTTKPPEAATIPVKPPETPKNDDYDYVDLIASQLGGIGAAGTEETKSEVEPNDPTATEEQRIRAMIDKEVEEQVKTIEEKVRAEAEKRMEAIRAEAEKRITAAREEGKKEGFNEGIAKGEENIGAELFHKPEWKKPDAKIYPDVERFKKKTRQTLIRTAILAGVGGALTMLTGWGVAQYLGRSLPWIPFHLKNVIFELAKGGQLVYTP